MNKYEQLIEHIINDEEGKARALFHDIVVEKSRDIYESLMDEEYTEEGIGGDQVGGLVDEITMDETDGIGEGEDEFDMEPEMDMDDMSDMDDMGGEQDLEAKVMDLESELEALKAEFEQLMGDEAGEEEHSDMDFGSDDEDSGEEMFGDKESDENEEEMFEAHNDESEDESDRHHLPTRLQVAGE